MADFDPYHRWLQIPANEQPANHYRLLGLVLFESDPDVIENAANQRLAHLRTFQSGPNGAISQQIMNEVTQAKLALLVPETKAAYDSQLQAAIEAQRIANEAAANPFSQLNVGGDNPATTGNRIQLPGAESVPTATSRPSLQGAPAFSSATSSATGAAMPKVINRPPKRTAAWILPVAIVGLLLFLLIGIGGAAAFFVLSRSDSNSVAVIDPNKAADSKKIDDKSNEATKSNNQKKQKKNSDQLANAESSGIEILDLFQLPHNLHSGQAEITEAGLVLKNNPCINTVSIPVALPLEYDLKTRITGDGRAIVFGIPVNGHVAHLSIDTYNDKQTGLGGIDGIQIGAKDYPGNTHIGQVIAEGTETNLTISVRERSVKLFRDEPSGERREIYSWTGDSSRLSPHKLYETVEPYRFCPGISTYRGTEFTLHSLKVIPLGEHASDNDWLAKARIRPPVETLGAPVDLLALYEDKFIIEKPVTPEGDGVEVGSTSTPFAGTMFPYDLPEEYDVDMSVLNGGNRALYISPMIAGKRSAIEVDNKADDGKKTFLSMIDSRPGGGPTYPGYYEEEVLPLAKSVPLKFKIRKNGVRVIANGEEIYRWIGNTDRLGERNKERIPPEFKNYLGVFAQGSPILIEKLTVTPVKTSIEKTSTDILADWGIGSAPPIKTASQREDDLLKIVQLPEHLLSGDAEITEEGLALLSEPPCLSRVVIPVTLPPEYDLHASITGTGRTVLLGFHVDGYPVTMMFDKLIPRISGIEKIDGKELGANGYSAKAFEGDLLPPGAENDITISVRRGSVVVRRDDEEIFAWTGDASTLTPSPKCETLAPFRLCPSISTYKNGSCVLNSLRIEPKGGQETNENYLTEAKVETPGEKLGEAVDLLKKYDPQYALHKQTEVRDDGIQVGPGGGYGGTMLHYDLPPEYDIDMQIKRIGGGPAIVSPVIGGKRTAIEIDTPSRETWLGAIDGFRGGPNHVGTHKGPILTNNVSVPVRLKVRKNGIRILADGQEVYRWIGDTSRIGPKSAFNPQDESKNSFGIFGYNATIVYEKVSLIPVETEFKNNSTEILAAWNANSKSVSPESIKPVPEDELATGEPISMLPMLKLPDNLRCGRAQVKSRKLQLESIDSNNIVDFPVMLPQDYDIETQVKRVSPDDSFIFGIHVGGYPCTLAVDGYPKLGYRTGLGMVNGKDIHSAENPGIHKGQLLPQDKFVKLKVRVRKQSVELFVEDKSVYRWQGDPSVLSMHAINQPPYSLRYNLWVGSWKTQYLVNYVHLIPRGTAAETQDWLEKSTYGKFSETRSRPVNLLTTLNADSIIAEPIKKDSRGLIIGDSAARRSGVEFPYEVPTDYDIECSLMTGGPNGVVILPVIGGHRAGLYIDNLYRGDSRTALSRIDGHFAYGGYHPGKQPGTFLEKGKLANILCQVRSDGVRLFIDGQYIYGWFGKADRLSPADWPGFEIDSLKHLRIVTQANSVLVKSLAIRPVEVEGRLEPVALLEKLSEINPGMIDEVMIADFARAEEAGFIREPMETEQTDDTDTNDTNDSPFKTNFDIPKLRELNADEQAEMKEIDKAIRSVVSSLEKQDYDKASPVIANAASVATYDETKQKTAALTILKSDVQSFWETVSKTCGDLQAGHEIELSNGVAVVVESSSERIVMQYNGQSIRKAPTELPMGLAMNLVESAITTPSAEFLRSKGSIYFVDAFSNKDSREKAGQFWQAAADKGADTGPLMMLLAE